MLHLKAAALLDLGDDEVPLELSGALSTFSMPHSDEFADWGWRGFEHYDGLCTFMLGFAKKGVIEFRDIYRLVQKSILAVSRLW